MSAIRAWLIMGLYATGVANAIVNMSGLQFATRMSKQNLRRYDNEICVWGVYVLSPPTIYCSLVAPRVCAPCRCTRTAPHSAPHTSPSLFDTCEEWHLTRTPTRCCSSWSTNCDDWWVMTRARKESFAI